LSTGHAPWARAPRAVRGRQVVHDPVADLDSPPGDVYQPGDSAIPGRPAARQGRVCHPHRAGAPPVVHKDIADLAPEQEEEGEAIPLHEGKSLWTARVNARSRDRAGDRIELGVDTRNLHFFDPDSGLAIGVKQAAELRP
jgi:hypothetical protein